MAFELASTNLVIELDIILIVLMGWQFVAEEFAGGILMVILIALIFRLILTPRLVQMARTQAEKGLIGKMEGHAAMDMSVPGGTFFSRLFSGKGLQKAIFSLSASDFPHDRWLAPVALS